MSISIIGQSRVPPGFRFHPTEEELLHYYLRKKMVGQVIDLDVIQDVDLNKLEPWDIQEKCKIGSTPQNEWYFFSHKDKKYPTGTRTNRATAYGFWKATGRDKVIYCSFRRIGLRKTLVFYSGRAPHGQKSDWIMYEYRLDNGTSDTNTSNSMEETTYENGWVVCRLFKKKTHQKALESANSSWISTDMRTQMLNSGNDCGLEQILQYMMERTCKEENETRESINMRFLSTIDTEMGNGHHENQSFPNNIKRFDHAYENQSCFRDIDVQMLIGSTEASITSQGSGNTNPVYETEPGFANWAALDRFVASHLNGQVDTSKQLACFNNPNMVLFSP